MSREEIEKLLPHRSPFLFVDEVNTDGDTITARHVFTADEFFFAGHFPQYPVVPGVILIETMAQSGGAALLKQGKLGGNAGPSPQEDVLFFLASVDKVKFRRQVRPGEEVRSVITNLRVSAKMIKQSGKAYVGDELAAEAEWLCLVGEAPSQA
jgi:3-hydroxyacyl-[acyl-carrier-protein] dehydratase